jgi:hypothetical protein
VLHDINYLTADEEDEFVIAQAVGSAFEAVSGSRYRP